MHIDIAESFLRLDNEAVQDIFTDLVDHEGFGGISKKLSLAHLKGDVDFVVDILDYMEKNHLGMFKDFRDMVLILNICR